MRRFARAGLFGGALLSIVFAIAEAQSQPARSSTGGAAGSHEKFDAPKAQLARLVIEGLLGPRDDWYPVRLGFAVVLLLFLLHGIPILLAWDFAKGSRRRAWVWVTFAFLGSWLVVPATWIARLTAEDAGANDA